MSSVQEIHAALTYRLSQAGYSTAYENIPYTPPASVWVRETFAPLRQAAAALGAAAPERVTGLYMVDVFAPAGDGWKAGGDAAAVVMGYFTRGLSLTSGSTVVSIDRSYRQAGRVEKEWFHIPVTVAFRAEVAA